jgi:DNA (cytosine-5)-methyltransferase 1
MGMRNGKLAVARKKASESVQAGGEQPNLTVASFFSGIGGFDLGFQNAGLSISYQCEIDQFCRSILERHWPKIPRSKDIKEVRDALSIPVCGIWAGGFPCQDVSLARARKRDGLNGRNTSLFFEFARLIGDARPTAIILENVPGLLSSHGGRDFGIVLSTLAELGYGVAWRVLDSQHFGVPQSRRRLYLAGFRGDPARAATLLFEPERSERNPETRRRSRKKSVSPFKEVAGDPRIGPVVQKIGYCLAATSGRHTGTDWSRTYVTYPDAVRRLTPLEAERIQGFPDGWTIPEGMSSKEIATLDSPRYAALGNAVTVPVAEWLANRLIHVL